MSANNTTVPVPSNVFTASKEAWKAHGNLFLTGRFSRQSTAALFFLTACGVKSETARKIANTVAAECGAMFDNDNVEDWSAGKKGLAFKTKGQKVKEQPINAVNRLVSVLVSMEKLAAIGVDYSPTVDSIEGLAAWIAKLES